MEIRVIFTGGTIGSRLHGDSLGTDTDAPHELLKLYREKSGDDTVFATAAPYTILSENLKFHHITKLAACIKGSWSILALATWSGTVKGRSPEEAMLFLQATAQVMFVLGEAVVLARLAGSEEAPR